MPLFHSLVHRPAWNFVAKTNPYGSPRWRFRDSSLHRFDTDPECDGRTDGRTGHGYDARSILLSRVKTIGLFDPKPHRFKLRWSGRPMAQDEMFRTSSSGHRCRLHVLLRRRRWRTGGTWWRPCHWRTSTTMTQFYQSSSSSCQTRRHPSPPLPPSLIVARQLPADGWQLGRLPTRRRAVETRLQCGRPVDVREVPCWDVRRASPAGPDSAALLP